MRYDGWLKSSYSVGGNANCVEARLAAASAVDVRDSKNPDLPHLSFSATEWYAFLAAAQQEELG